MGEVILGTINPYVAAALLIFTGAIVVLLWKVYGQIKELNFKLGTISESFQGYFAAILQEDTEENAAVITGGSGRKEEFLVREEGNEKATERKRMISQEEEVINSVFQEFFS